MSTGWPTRLRATLVAPYSIAASPPWTRVMPVSIMPGCTELTRMPLGPSSIAAALVMPRIANLVAEYAVHIASPPRPSIEEAFTIDPPPFLRMVRATDFMPRKQPSWLMLTISMYSSTSIRSTCEAQDAGVVDQHVDRPEALVGLLDQRLPGGLVADVVTAEVRRVGVLRAELGSECLAGLLGDVGDDDLGALLDERPGDGLALSLCGAGDDGALACESVGHDLSFEVEPLGWSCITASAAKPTAGSRSAK